jgi:hypothetical protein
MLRHSGFFVLFCFVYLNIIFEATALSGCPSCRHPVCIYCCNIARGLSPCHLCAGFPSCPFLGSDQSHSLTRSSLPAAPRHASLFRSHDGGLAATKSAGDVPEVYYIGVIDFLQPFNLRKNLEQQFKTVVMARGDEMLVSVLEPKKYAARLVEFVKKLLFNPIKDD